MYLSKVCVNVREPNLGADGCNPGVELQTLTNASIATISTGSFFRAISIEWTVVCRI
jgi:hypothetical protein